MPKQPIFILENTISSGCKSNYMYIAKMVSTNVMVAS